MVPVHFRVIVISSGPTLVPVLVSGFDHQFLYSVWSRDMGVTWSVCMAGSARYRDPPEVRHNANGD